MGIQEKIKFIDKHEKEHNVQIKILTDKLAAMDSTELMKRNDLLESGMRRIKSERNEYINKMDQQDLIIQDYKVKVHKMEDQLHGAAAENSKLLVGSNQNAKATHIQNVKMSLNRAQQEKAQLEVKLKESQKQQEKSLYDLTSTYKSL
jgi:hypothetical protein